MLYVKTSAHAICLLLSALMLRATNDFNLLCVCGIALMCYSASGFIKGFEEMENAAKR